MKNILKVLTALLIMNFIEISAYSQNAVVPRPATAVETPAVAPVGKPMIITLKNNAEKPVVIFAGHKEEIRDPKLITPGGLSKNTLYLNENDVVCLMTNDKRALSCTMIKAGTTLVEVNVSANIISSK